MTLKNTHVVPQNAGLMQQGVTRRHCLSAGIAACLGSACSIDPDEDHTGRDAPSSAELARKPRTAWVLSSGGPRGFAHIGVIKALAEMQLRPDLIVGASAGSLVGVLYCSGMSAPGIETLAIELQPWQLARVNLSRGEAMSGAGVAQFVRSHLAQPLLQQLATPVVCVAQRISDGAAVGFNHGDAGVAVQAACAIEGQFTPVRIHGQRYRDADQCMPLPVRMARALGATRVLAIDASAFEERAPPGSERYRAGDLRKRALTQPDAALADVVLRPDFGYWVNLSREFRERAIAAGYRATMAAAVRVRELHAG